MGSSSPLILEISSDEEFDFGAIQGGGDGGGGGEFGGGDCLDWLSELLGEVGENKVDKNDASDDVVLVREVLPKKPKRPGFEVLKPVNKETVDHKVDVDEEDDDCVILDDDPDKPVVVVKEKIDLRDSGDNGGVNDDDDDLEIVCEKGEVACRDFPHPRHLCAKFPFDSTSHEVHCAQCHCYVCDSLAPCSRWGTGKTSHDHCHASDMFEHWKTERKNMKQGENSASPSTKPVGPLGQNPVTRPTIIRPCSRQSVNYDMMKHFSQAAFPQMQHNTHNTNFAASRSQRLNIGNPTASSFTSSVAFKRSLVPLTFPRNKRVNRSQPSGKVNYLQQIQGALGSIQQNVPSPHSVSPHVTFPAPQNVASVTNMFSQPQLSTPRPYATQTQAQTAFESRKRKYPHVPRLQQEFGSWSIQNMNIARPVYPNRHVNPSPPSQSNALHRPIARYTSGYQLGNESMLPHDDLNVDSYQTASISNAQNGVGLSQNFSVGSSSVHLQVPEPEATLPGDSSQYHSAIEDGNLKQQQQTIGLVDTSSLNPNHTDACLSPESTRQESLLDLNGWFLGNSSSEEPFTVPLSPVWNMFSPEPASLGTDVHFDY